MTTLDQCDLCCGSCEDPDEPGTECPHCNGTGLIRLDDDGEQVDIDDVETEEE